MTRPTRLGRGGYPLNSELGGTPGQPSGSESDPDCCDVGETPPDRADQPASAAVRLSTGSSTPTLVQSKGAISLTSFLTDITLDDPPTAGNLLVLIMHDRTQAPADMNVPDGFSTLVSNAFAATVVSGHLIAYKVSDGTETTVAFSNDTPTSNGAPETAALLEFSGFSGATLDTSDVADVTNDSTATFPSITPSGVPVIIIASSVKQPDNPGTNRTLTGYTLAVDTGNNGTGNRHRLEVFYRIANPASGSYTATLSDSGDASDDSNLIHAALSGTAPAWNIPAPNAIDGDDATYETITGTDLLRVDLGAAHRIVRTRIRIAGTNAGARTLTIKGANLPDFSDETTLATIPFTATGSLTAQDVTAQWITSTSYRYFELSIGTSDTYRIHTWSLYEQTPGSIIVTDPTNSDAPDDLQDVIDNLYDAIGTGLGWFDVTDYGATGDGSTDDTSAIQDAIDAAEAAGGGVVYFPRGVYIIGGALQDTGRSNAQLLLPRIDYADSECMTVVLMGESSPPTVASVIGSTPLPDGGVVIKSTLSAGTGALLGCHGPVGTFGDFSNVRVTIRDITFRMVADPTNTCLDLSRVAMADLSDVTVDAGDYSVGSLAAQTTSTSFGVRTPGNGNAGFTRLDRVIVIGFYKGIEVGEHATGDMVSVVGCRQAAVFITADHASHFDRFMNVHCIRGLVFTGHHYFSIDQYNIEHADTGTWVQVYDIDDASNFGHGHLAWHVVLANTGVDHTFTVNGATDIYKVEVGDNPFGGASFATPAIVLGTAAAAGAASTAIRSDSTIVAFDATVPTTQAFGDAAATGAAAVAARRDHKHAMPADPVSAAALEALGVVGAILISDDHSTPIVFADILLTEAGDDILYADLGG